VKRYQQNGFYNTKNNYVMLIDDHAFWIRCMGNSNYVNFLFRS